MSTIVFHGSPLVVEKPDLARCRPHSDYGRAFYCTFSADLAKEWACEDAETSGYANTYEFDNAHVRILDLDDHPDGVLAWIAVLLENRTLDHEWNLKDDVARFLDRYHVDLSGYDVVTGYRADDSYFSIARAFASGSITDLQLARALKLGELGKQIAFRTQKAIDALTFVEATRADGREWGLRRARRDQGARRAFASMRQEPETRGKRIHELGGEL